MRRDFRSQNYNRLYVNFHNTEIAASEITEQQREKVLSELKSLEMHNYSSFGVPRVIISIKIAIIIRPPLKKTSLVN